MDSMRKAIMNRRMKLAGDVDHDEMRDANFNPDEGSRDDLDIARAMGEAEGEDQENPPGDGGQAPDTSSMSDDLDQAPILQENEQMDSGRQASMDDFQKMFTKDDVGKPGIRGKAAAKMMAAMKALKR